MVGAVEDVLEAHRHEPERGLVPARVEHHDAGVAPQLERPLGPARREEAEDGDDPQAIRSKLGRMEKSDWSDWMS